MQGGRRWSSERVSGVDVPSSASQSARCCLRRRLRSRRPTLLRSRRPHARASHLHDAAGIHVVGSRWVDTRLLDVTVSTTALAAPVHVNVLVPDSYTTHRASRYPSLYLLHGCAAGRPSTGLEYQDWTAGLDAERITATTDAIVVMPEAGGGGFYTDWVNGGNGGPPMWETFHVGQLVPWIDANFRTIPDRGERAIAGLSMGGFGALSYAARHPDVFGTTASFSGAADLTDPVDQAEPASSVVVAACAAADGGGPDSTFGSHQTDELNWRAHDPARIAGNLSDTAIYLYTGNGQPGPLDPPGRGTDAIEVLAGQATVLFHTRLEALGIPSFFDDYGAGTHTGPYSERDLRDVLPRIVADFAAHRRVTSFTYQTAAPTLLGLEHAGRGAPARRRVQRPDELRCRRLHTRRERVGVGGDGTRVPTPGALRRRPLGPVRGVDEPTSRRPTRSAPRRAATRTLEPVSAIHGCGRCRRHSRVHHTRLGGLRCGSALTRVSGLRRSCRSTGPTRVTLGDVWQVLAASTADTDRRWHCISVRSDWNSDATRHVVSSCNGRSVMLASTFSEVDGRAGAAASGRRPRESSSPIARQDATRSVSSVNPADGLSAPSRPRPRPTSRERRRRARRYP